jgi:hypothetical protein
MKKDSYNDYLLKRICRAQTKKLIRQGVIEAEPCQVCGEVQVQVHHPDYSNPMNVMWLCPTHHGLQHKFENHLNYLGSWEFIRPYMALPNEAKVKMREYLKEVDYVNRALTTVSAAEMTRKAMNG